MGKEEIERRGRSHHVVIESASSQRAEEMGVPIASLLPKWGM